MTEDLIPTRKAFSAEKSKDTCESDFFSDVPNDLERTFKTCSSASFLSSRGRRRNFHNLLSESTFPSYPKVDNNDDQKLFLNASQILEKLNRIIARNTMSPKDSSDFDSAETSHTTPLSLRKVILYHDVLKKLLEERCTLILKEECDMCIKRTIKLIENFKQLYMNEKLKMMTMPIQACNRFINCNDTSFSTLQLLIKKLHSICDLHSSISSNYQKIINCFHVGFDMELYREVSKTNRYLSKLKCDLFYWASKSMTIFMQKLCLADPNSVSTDFLQTVFEACIVFNLLIKEDKVLNSKYTKTCDLFQDFFIKYECAGLPFSLVLNYLAFFEAKAGAEKIVHFLTSACKKCRQVDLKRKLCDIDHMKKSDCDTSDYCSDIDPENSGMKSYHFLNVSSSFGNVWCSIVQRNQSLILKYLYSITTLQNSGTNKLKRRASSDSSTKSFTVRPVWDIPDQSIQDDRYILLEEMYWTSFWNNVLKFVLKVLYEVPYHQYGDAVAGTIILWPDSFLHTLTECLKLNADNIDIPAEGKYVIKQIYDFIFVHRIQLLWIREFSLALSASHAHLCPPVPTQENVVRTYTGNLLYTCLELILNIFSGDYQDMDTFLLVQSLQQLQSTLDYFNLWAYTKTRALMSSQNLSSYFLLSSSDCSSASKLLENKIISAISIENCSSTFKRNSLARIHLESTILKQNDILKGFQAEAPHFIYNLCFSTVKKSLLHTLKYESSWKQCVQNVPAYNGLETLLLQLDEAIQHLSSISPIALAIISGTAQAFLWVLCSKRSTNSKYVQLMCGELGKFLQWLENLNLPETEKEELKQQNTMRKLCYLMKCIEKSVSQNRICFKSRNKISPITNEFDLEESELNEKERHFLLSLRTRRLFSSFC